MKEEERRTKKNKTTTRNSIRNKKKNRKGDDIEEKNEELEVEEVEEDDSGTIVRNSKRRCVGLIIELWPLFEERLHDRRARNVGWINHRPNWGGGPCSIGFADRSIAKRRW